MLDHNQGVSELSNEIWRRVLGINLDGSMFATRRALQYMIKQASGSVINTVSIAGLSGAAAGVAYTVSKHALIGLTRSTAWMYGPTGIRCNAICPGGVKTNIGETIDPAKQDPAGSARTRVPCAHSCDP